MIPELSEILSIKKGFYPHIQFNNLLGNGEKF